MSERRASKSLWFSVFLAAVCLIGLAASAPTGMLSPAFSSPPKKKKKRKLSRYQWKKLMNRWSREIGKKCVYCHVQEGEDQYDYKKSTPNKKIAAYCDEHFVSKLKYKKRAVSCQTCHQRKARFLPRTKTGKGEQKGKG